MSVLDTLNAASPATRTVRLIVDKALHSEWHRLNAQLASTADSGVATSLAAEGVREALEEATKIVDRMEEIRDQVEAAEVAFTFTQLPWVGYLSLKAEHAPREGNLVDLMNGYNVETFPPALVRASCSEVAGTDDTQSADDVPEETWQRLFATFNIHQMNELLAGAWQVNDGSTSVPPSARSLLASQDSGTSLAQPSPGTSPRSDSAAGSRPTSRKSSTAKKAATKKAASSGSSRG